MQYELMHNIYPSKTHSLYVLFNMTGCSWERICHVPKKKNKLTPPLIAEINCQLRSSHTVRKCAQMFTSLNAITTLVVIWFCITIMCGRGRISLDRIGCHTHVESLKSEFSLSVSAIPKYVLFEQNNKK